MIRRIPGLALLAIVAYALATNPGDAVAQDPKKDPPKVIPKGVVYVQMVGDDCVVTLPDGLKWTVQPSPNLKVKAKVEKKMDGRLLIREKPPEFGVTGGDEVVFQLRGTIKKVVWIGLPEGYVGEIKKSEDPAKKEPDKK